MSEELPLDDIRAALDSSKEPKDRVRNRLKEKANRGVRVAELVLGGDATEEELEELTLDLMTMDLEALDAILNVSYDIIEQARAQIEDDPETFQEWIDEQM